MKTIFENLNFLILATVSFMLTHRMSVYLLSEVKKEINKKPHIWTKTAFYGGFLLAVLGAICIVLFCLTGMIDFNSPISDYFLASAAVCYLAASLLDIYLLFVEKKRINKKYDKIASYGLFMFFLLGIICFIIFFQ